MKKKKAIETLVKVLIGIYFTIAFILSINGNLEAVYLNVIGLAMFLLPVGVHLLG